jgi:hypothetical protein
VSLGTETKILHMKMQCSLETLKADYPVMQHNIPEEQNPQTTRKTSKFMQHVTIKSLYLHRSLHGVTIQKTIP